MNEGDPKNREQWVQNITPISEISSTDHSRNRTTDKRMLYVTNAVFMPGHRTYRDFLGG
jgi:hypothetical protein